MKSHKTPIYSDNSLLKSLSLATELGALFHDLGKATDGFQKKLRLVFSVRKRNNLSLASDPVRHELVSTFIVARFFDHVDRDGWASFQYPNQVREWFRLHARPAVQSRHDEYLDLQKRAFLDPSASVFMEASAPRPFDLKRFETDTFAASVLWLVLTHHRLPRVTAHKRTEQARRGRRSAVTDPRIDLSASVLGYVNSNVFDRLDEFFDIKDPMAEGHPWNDHLWCQRVARMARKMMTEQDHIPSVDFMEPSVWVTGLLYQARPALVFGDHSASSRKQPSAESAKSKLVVANTLSIDDVPFLGDALGLHLIKSNADAARYFNVLFRKSDDALKQLDVIAPEAISKDLTFSKAPAPYDWQNHLEQAAEGTEGRPTLAFIMAETGTGKTRGCIKFANALSPNGLRCTVGLGLRTLADQTYNDYLQFPISLPEQQVGRMIGSYYPIKEPREDSLGTSATEDLGNSVLMGDGEDKDQWHLLPQTAIFNGKKQALFTKAVTSMTIDNIIQAVGVRSGIDTHILMHLMHSDLIVDEIDNFSPADLSFVTALVHIMGFYGRNVILATATINEVIVQAMSEAYGSGIRKRSMLYDTPEPRVTFIKSRAPFYQVAELDGSIAEAYRSFVGNKAPETGNARHRPEVLTCVSHRCTMGSVYRILKERIEDFIRTHSEKQDGLDLSTGFVRFNTVKAAQRFSVWLTRQPTMDDTHIEVVCYHSKTTAFERYIQEYHLNHLMKRKGQVHPSDIAQARDGLFQRAREAGASRVCVVVVTTNIIEVGRDHDYDWCILEPSSLASYIQSIGRVLRHRKEKVVDDANIALLNAPLKVVDTTERIWAYPGIETPDIAVQEGRHEGFYKLKDTPDVTIRSRNQALGMGVREDKRPEPVMEATRLLGRALMAPSNQWALQTPAFYDDLPEHALNLIRLTDYLRKDGVPANKRNREGINAGNVSHYSGFQLAQALGNDVMFRAGADQVQLTCQTIDASYANNWVSDQEGHDMQVTVVTDLPEDRFLLNHIDRDRFVAQYLARFRYRKGQEMGIQSQLFQVSLYESDTEDLNFSRHLGMCRSDILDAHYD